MIKVLFLIHDLGQGGAEKVLVNLVNNMDVSKFDITVMSLFGGGVNEQFLKPEIRYLTMFKKMIPANSKLMKLMTPMQLHRLFIKEHYDVEIAYLEGPSARIISGCPDESIKKVAWIHVEHHSMKKLSMAFRSEKETTKCYQRFDDVVCVSQYVLDDFTKLVPSLKRSCVLYNTVESSVIVAKATERVNFPMEQNCVKLIAVGTLKNSKGYDRLLRIIKRLNEEYRLHLYILGKGPMRAQYEEYINQNELSDTVTLLGYDANPYKYVSKCDLFVCSSHSEGFSTAATEALIVGTPVCTVEVSGMKEMLGENNEYGIVTENDEEALYEGIKNLLDNPVLLKHYQKQAEIRGRMFSTEKTVRAVEEMLLNL